MKVREIVLDTETTGLDADGGDRIIEMGHTFIEGDSAVLEYSKTSCVRIQVQFFAEQV
ncbi:exonuclease domain-containing protein [Candidatus Anaplasma sp. TIGMIC]|nr:exonuclease domain-containing protein [Candidatus Anaplasma sp. TIGMIC]MDB1135644.1 exonuclease domain-containing protein [Candidatus Anaplasma sp. TIGMIC]